MYLVRKWVCGDRLLKDPAEPGKPGATGKSKGVTPWSRLAKTRAKAKDGEKEKDSLGKNVFLYK